MSSAAARGLAAVTSKKVVLIPAFNEQATVESVISEVAQMGLPAVVVDDGSSDRTAVVARRAGATVLQLPINLGVGGALRCGFRWAVANGYSTVIQCDADGQHDPREIGDLITAASEAGAHLTVGSRFLERKGFDSTAFRRLAMRQLARTASRSARAPITDPTSGFRVIREPLLSQFAEEYPTHYLGDTFGALYDSGRAGFIVRETAVRMRERAGGTPSANTLASLRYLLRAFLTVALRSGHRYSREDVPTAEK
jgi:glycosyltransferase involved in cell wall biosynthesis